MKAFSLAFLRISAGLLLVIWGALRFAKPDIGVGLAQKYYSGLLQGPMLQHLLGAAEALLGALVVLGLFRRFTLPLQAAVLIFGAAAIWKYLLDPFGLYLLSEETRQILFFPSLGMAAASLVLVAFRQDDLFALDRLFFKRS